MELNQIENSNIRLNKRFNDYKVKKTIKKIKLDINNLKKTNKKHKTNKYLLTPPEDDNCIISKYNKIKEEN